MERQSYPFCGIRSFAITAACCVLLITLGVRAQQMTAVTSDGRQVVLKPDGTWVFAESKRQDRLEVESRSLDEVATDRIAFIDKTVRVTGILSPITSYFGFYRQAEATHFAFYLGSPTGASHAYIYVPRGPMADRLRREITARGGRLSGEFDILFTRQSYEASKGLSEYIGELTDYRSGGGPSSASPVDKPRLVESSRTTRDLTPKQIAEKSMPSTVWIVMKRGRNVVSGSGFFILPDVVATNFHVIEGMSEGLIKVYGDEETYRILGVVGFDKENDLALLKIEGVTGKPLPLNRDDSTAIGDDVYAVGNPEGLEGTFSQGIVSALRKSEGLLQLTAPISHGSSGGAVLNNRGEVIGIAVATKKIGQALNFAIPVDLLLRMDLYKVPRTLPIR